MPETAGHKITMTGADVETVCDIPVSFRYIKLKIYHSSADVLKVELYTQTPGTPGKSGILANFRTIKQRVTHRKGETEELPRGTKLTLVANTTSADTIIPEIYIQKVN